MMGAVYFYHLTRSPLELTLQTLLTRALQNGWRAAVRGTDAARLKWLDEQLWLSPPDSFLPHGLAGGPHDADQPVLLTTAPANLNNAAYLVLIDGAALDAAELPGWQRANVILDGDDPAALARARTQWKALTDAGVSAQYHSEESGRWQMKAER